MQLVIGVDEAGRGPLAGPVAVGVVAVPEGFDFLAAFPGLNDSKKLTEKKRESLFALLEVIPPHMEVSWCVEFSDAETIDREGITKAVRDALERGVRKLLPDHAAGRVYLDGLLHAPPEYAQETIVGGDAKVPAIMLASVAAKVLRDRFMKELALAHPAYGFDIHKGYGTKAHYAALEAYGPCALHRESYLLKFNEARKVKAARIVRR